MYGRWVLSYNFSMCSSPIISVQKWGELALPQLGKVFKAAGIPFARNAAIL
jgi:hypothetical protein